MWFDHIGHAAFLPLSDLMTEEEGLTCWSSRSRNRPSCPADSPDSATSHPGWAPRRRGHTAHKHNDMRALSEEDGEQLLGVTSPCNPTTTRADTLTGNKQWQDSVVRVDDPWLMTSSESFGICQLWHCNMGNSRDESKTLMYNVSSWSQYYWTYQHPLRRKRRGARVELLTEAAVVTSPWKRLHQIVVFFGIRVKTAIIRLSGEE